MAVTYKVLAQVRPSTTADTTVYTVPAGTTTVVSSMVLTNSAANTAFTVSATVRLRIGGAAVATSQILMNTTLTSIDTQAFTSGITLNAGDVITVTANLASALTMHVFGSEIT